MNPTIGYTALGIVIAFVAVCIVWLCLLPPIRTRKILKRGPEPVHVMPLPYPTAPTLTVVCAWCGTVVKKGNGKLVSHGICEPCRCEQLEIAKQQMAGGGN